MTSGPRKKVVVVGLGMVGIAFIEKLLKLDARSREYEIVVIGEEPYLAYNRVGLTSFFSNRKIENLYLNPQDWYTSYAPENQLGCHVNTLVTSIDGENKNVTCSNGEVVSYDVLVLATGSDAVLPKHTPGYDATGVFVYRTIDDLQKLIAYGETKRGAVGAVVGGGLLGLEAAKAMMDLGCFAKIKLVERNEWVLSRQLDADAGGLVVEKVAGLGIDVLLSKRVGRVRVDEGNAVTGVVFEDGETMDCAAVCFAIGVRPRDQLARQAGLRCADRGGGIVVDDELRTSWPDVYAVGECASWKDQTFGLIAPGVEMADVLAFNLTQARLHRPRAFRRPDLSTKLKLLGVDVASFGDFFADRDGPAHLPGQAARERRKEKTEAEGKGADAVRAAVKGRPPPPVKALTYKDPFQHVYKKYLFTEDGKYLLGGMMIGDTSDYVKLVPMVKNQKPLEVPPAQLILGARKEGEEDDGADLDDDTQICSCHNVTKGDVVGRVKDGTCKSLGDVKACTKAGTGCGGCMPLVTTIFNATMKAMGNEVTNYVCAHFNHSRADLYHIVLARRLTAFADVMRAAGNAPGSDGCEACKPVVASLFASLWNRHVLDRPVHGLQETNDRYLGNIQRDGTFSVVPRVSAGEITPDKLIVLGEVAQQYGLYTKITGGQRIDLFGARKTDLPAIWQRLVAAGMESGHAYAKSLRTVKSCVGSTWCRFGIGDSVGLAVRLEERYKSIRAPHKIKGGVSGCVRECAEAQSKDFGLIATDKGFNIFVCGNGGAKPRHADLLAKDVPPADVVPILDRFLMFYIRTADKLQRTARWLEQLPGGLRYLQAVVLDDKLGINASLEAQMQALVDSFFDEWAETVATPALAARFRQFANTDATTAGVETQRDRGQARPVDWPRAAADDDFAGLRARWSTTAWQPVLEAAYFAGADDAPNGISATIRRGDTQLALFRVRGRYYCTQQMCPHKRAFALSDGLIGHPVPAATADDNDTAQTPTTKTESSTPYVSCPFHKRNYDLTTGGCSNDGALSIATFDVEERAADGMVYVKLPPVAELDAALGTARWRVTKADTAADPAPFAALDKKIAFKGLRAKKPGVRPLADVPTMRRPVELLPAAAAAAAGGCGGAPDW